MQYITTTELRTKSKQLVKELRIGKRVKLIHRSKVIGRIEPSYEPNPLSKKDIKELKSIATKLNLPKLSYQERERLYRRHLVGKYDR